MTPLDIVGTIKFRVKRSPLTLRLFQEETSSRPLRLAWSVGHALIAIGDPQSSLDFG